MKRCGKCGQLKANDEFHRSSRRGHQAWCKACRKVYDAVYHGRNRARRRRQKQQYWLDFATRYSSLKEGRPCADCGAVRAPVAMQWDHLPGSKRWQLLALCAIERTGRKSWRRSPSASSSVLTAMPCVHLRDAGRSSVWSERCVWDAEVSPVRIRPPRSRSRALKRRLCVLHDR